LGSENDRRKKDAALGQLDLSDHIACADASSRRESGLLTSTRCSPGSMGVARSSWVRAFGQVNNHSAALADPTKITGTDRDS
jgi:hypothetical protein